MGRLTMTIDDSSRNRILQAIRHLEAVGVELEQGLKEQEFLEIERDWEFTFPADLRWFLGQRVPVGSDFPSWREPSRNLKRLFDRPLEGIVFDVENSGYWRDGWGQRPNSEQLRYECVRTFVADAPKLIPVAAHVYLPAVQHDCAVPVFAVYQTDIIHCGKDLAAYLMFYGHDEDLDEDDYPPAFNEEYPETSVWTELARENGQGIRPLFKFADPPTIPDRSNRAAR